MKFYHGSASNLPPPRVHAPGRTLHIQPWSKRAWIVVFITALLGLLWQWRHTWSAP